MSSAIARRPRSAPPPAAVLAALGGLLLALPAAAQDPAIREAAVGIAGRYRLGCWTPVRVVLRGGAQPTAATLELSAPDADGLSMVVAQPLQLSPAAQHSLTLYTRIGRPQAQLELTLRSSDRLLARRTLQLAGPGEVPLHRKLVVLLGAPPSSLPPPDSRPAAPLLVPVSRWSELPDQWLGYEAVDAVVLLTALPPADPAANQRLPALHRWAELGGQVVVSAARRAAELARDPATSWLVPGAVLDLVPLRQWAPLAAFAAATPSRTAANASDLPPAPLEVARLGRPLGRVELDGAEAAGSLPLVVRAPLGFGQVRFLAVDLDGPPLDTWPGRGPLLERLLCDAPHANAAADQPAPFTGQAPRDLAGLLRGKLQEFSGVQVVPFWLVATLILCYAALVGPLDKFLLARLGCRREFTWLTFPLLVAAVSAAAYWAAHALKGSAVRVNQVHTVDYDLATSAVRGTTWASLFSPRPDRFQLALDPAPTLPGSAARLLAWWAPPESVGQAPPGVSPDGTLPGQSYHLDAALHSLHNLPLEIWSTKDLVARWSGQHPAPLAADLTDEGDGRLTGQVTSRLERPLDQAVLYYGDWAYPLGTLAPGQPRRLVRGEQSISRDSHFQSALGRDPNLPLETAAYPALTQLPTILLALSVHGVTNLERAGGPTHRGQPWIDCGHLLRAGRAVLLGFERRAAARLTRDGLPLAHDADDWTLHRFILPVAEPPSP
jgi:hypothetical protein